MSTALREALTTNRSWVLAWGGAEAERRAVALSAAEALPGAGLIEARDADALQRALGNARAVVYVPDVTALPLAAQRALVRVLREVEERPKLILGLPAAPEVAAEKGLLADDLRYWLAPFTLDVRARPSRR
jgi:hypothetical protein